MGEALGWPVFVKGARQTSKHRASLSIARNASELAGIFSRWRDDPILHWQTMVCREYADLKKLAPPQGDALPPAVELRCFLWQTRVVGIGPYWPGQPFDLSAVMLARARSLAEEVARRLALPLLVVDVGLTSDGRWVVIECDDAQESSFAGVKPLLLWQAIASGGV